MMFRSFRFDRPAVPARTSNFAWQITVAVDAIEDADARTTRGGSMEKMVRKLVTGLLLTTAMLAGCSVHQGAAQDPAAGPADPKDQVPKEQISITESAQAITFDSGRAKAVLEGSIGKGNENSISTLTVALSGGNIVLAHKADQGSTEVTAKDGAKIFTVTEADRTHIRALGLATAEHGDFAAAKMLAAVAEYLPARDYDPLALSKTRTLGQESGSLCWYAQRALWYGETWWIYESWYRPQWPPWGSQSEGWYDVVGPPPGGNPWCQGKCGPGCGNGCVPTPFGDFCAFGNAYTHACMGHDMCTGRYGTYDYWCTEDFWSAIIWDNAFAPQCF
jgi:hypothetical protein